MRARQTDYEIGVFLVLMFVIAFFTAVLGTILAIYISPKEWIGFNIIFTVPVTSGVTGLIGSLLVLGRYKNA